jgi:hypothetical protein
MLERHLIESGRPGLRGSPLQKLVRRYALMRKRFAFVFILASLASLGAEVRTTNFIVHAADAQVCQSIAQWAEHYRREKAVVWLGQEMPTWPQPCPLFVQVSMQGPSGATSFHFGQGRVLGMKMEIQGPLERLIHSVLPHEITHTVFAHHFRCPVPRWADEGGSVLSEDDIERKRHDELVRHILNQRQQIPLRTLFSLKEYPPQVMCLYAQGFSMSDYLVKRSDRRTFLSFIGAGQQGGWDNAVRSFYGHNTVEELESAWLQHLYSTRRQPNALVAQNQPKSGFQATTASRTQVRLTAPPVQPLEPYSVVRGSMPAPEQVGQRFGQATQWQPGAVRLQAPVPMNTAAPQFLPPTGARVQLGAPEFGTVRDVPPGASPIGFPR